MDVDPPIDPPYTAFNCWYIEAEVDGLLAQLAQFEGDFANFDGSPASQINGLAAVCGLIGRVVATKAIPFCRRV
jgi:hypothetical protein